MAAISTLFELFEPGDRIIADSDLYGGSVRLFEHVSRKNGIHVLQADFSTEDIERFISEKTKAIYFETPTNPMMRVYDIEKYARIAKKHKILLIIDNTFLSPYFQNPLNLGADIVVHSGTNCLKYDFASERGVIAPGENPNDLIPLWIADMDFKTSSFIQDALQKQVEHGIFGYTDTKEDYFSALQNFYLKRHRFFIPSDQWVIKTPGVMFMLAMAVNAFTQKGDAVLIQEPVYMHFRDLIEASGRKVASNDLIYTQEGRYAIDFDDFERKIVSEKVKLFLLCNPHNPVCRVWSKNELETIGEICLKHRVIIVSDEIHNDFIFRGTHTMMASLSKEISNITISVTAPTKTFNLAGLQIAHTFIRNESLRRAIRREIDAVAYSQVPSTGITAAYTKGETWLDALLEYIRGKSTTSCCTGRSFG